MYGGKIIGNRAMSLYGGGVFISGNVDGTEVVLNGEISDNTAKEGGGVYAEKAALTLNESGRIADNTAERGGGVFEDNVRFYLTGGAIVNNVANDSGGGVYASSGSFTYSAGKISENRADQKGGGVCAFAASFSMNEGVISTNTAEKGGGVYIGASTGFTMTGGSIADNTGTNKGGGVYLDDGALKLSQAPAIQNYTCSDQADNVYLWNGRLITVTGELTNATPIGVAMQTTGVFTSGLSGNGTAANFASDDGTLMIVRTESGELTLTQKPDFGTPDFILPTDITRIGEYAFEGISASIVYIPDGCTEIEPYAFKDCKNLTQIRIPAGCAIGGFAFEGCEDLYIFSVSGGDAEQYCQHHDNCTFVPEQ